MTALFRPARLNAFDAEGTVTPEAAAGSPRERYGTCDVPGMVMGACTSSEMTVTPWRSASRATSFSSARPNDVPVGLCGWLMRYARAPEAKACPSPSRSSVQPVPARASGTSATTLLSRG
jgi:hypothetical protein